MSFESEYLKLRKKRLAEAENKRTQRAVSSKKATSDSSFEENYLKLREKRLAEKKYASPVISRKAQKKDIAPVKNVDMSEEKNKLTEIPTASLFQNNPIASFNMARAENGDFAPVKQGDGYFQKPGVYDEGYQFGDITKAKQATNMDVAENLLTGVIGMGEKVVDALAWLAPAFNAGQAAQNGQPLDIEDYRSQQEWASEFIAADLYDENVVAQNILYPSFLVGSKDEWENAVGINVTKDSVFAEKSDALIQSVGQLGATAGLSAVGIPWFLTTGATSFGGEAENALRQGASYEAAGASAAISAGAEVLSEKLGGIKFGGKALDDVLLKPFTEKISNKVLKALVNMGIDSASEGFEEVFSQVCSNLGSSLYKEDSLSELLASEEAVDGYIDSFIGGAALGGLFGAGKAVVDSKPNTLNQNEQKVVDHVYNERVAEAETDGKKLTKGEKAKLYDEVVSEMDKGSISIDTIEEVLGGETYKTYKDTVNSEESMKQELEELRQMKNGDRNDIQNDRLAELKAIDFSDTSKRDGLKSQLGQEVYDLVKDTRLSESYNEKTRRSQAYEADLTKYDSGQQETIKRAVDSGILNNSKKTHEFVDLIAKIAADKGVSFDFADNAKLKESGFALEGKTVNGFVKDGNVTLNINSAKMLQSVVGHEITHVLEGTELYTELQEAVKAYATTKGVYDTRLQELTMLYEGVEDADVNAEITADLVGDYLFTDENFVKSLSAGKPNIFRKIFEEIKYLVKVATSGSKEARQLEKVKRMFEKVYREAVTQENHSSTKYSLNEFEDGRRFVEIDQDQDRFAGHDRGEYPRIAKDIINEKFNGKVIGIDNKMFVNGRGRDEYVNPSKYIEGEVYDAKLRSAGELDNLLDAGTNYRNVPDGRDGHYHADVVGGFDYYDTLFKIGDRYYEARINIKNIEKGKLFKDVTQIKDVTQDIMNSYGKNPKFQFLRTSSIDSISQTSENATKFSLSKDADSNYLYAVERGDTETAQKMVDEAAKEAGYTIKAYHGTNADFFAFDKGRVGKGTDQYGAGFYFATNKEAASSYGSRVINSALKLENPYSVSAVNLLDAEIAFTKKQAYEIVKRHPMMYDPEESPLGDYYDSYWENGAKEWMVKDLATQYSELGYLDSDLFRDYPNELHEAVRDVTGHDGVVVNLSNGEKFYVAWFDNQMKSTDPVTYDDNGDIIPLSKRFDEQKNDIRYSLSANKDVPPVGGRGIYGKDIALEAPTQEDIAPIRSDVAPAQPAAEDLGPVREDIEPAAEDIEPLQELAEEETATEPISTMKQRLEVKLNNLNTELANNQRLRTEAADSLDGKIAKLQSEYDAKKNKDTKYANNLLRRIETLKRRRADVDADYAKRISDIESRIEKTREKTLEDHSRKDHLETVYRKIDKQLEWDKAELEENFRQKREALEAKLSDKNTYISEKAKSLHIELTRLKKGVRASEQLGYILDHGYDWQSIKKAFSAVKHWPDRVVDPDSAIESIVREMLNEDYENSRYELDNLDKTLQRQTEKLEAEAEAKRKDARTANQRKLKQGEYTRQMADLIGDTSTWKDKRMGIQYATNTLRRNLREIVRNADGKRDIAKADTIYDELQGRYNTNEAMLNRETNQIKKVYADMKITSEEDQYIQMLGELRHNPDTTLTGDVVKEFYEKHKKHIDEAKVDKAIEMARVTYDSLLVRVNEVLKEQGMKEIPYRKGYFPHFTEERQSRIAKILNWKVKSNDIPTDIAGLTEQFNPNRSWQSFNKHRYGDTTDYSFTKGLDTYVQGTLDWIYHIEDIQKRRAFENYIRYVHSDEGIQDQIDELFASNQYDADEVQERIDGILSEAGNPLGNFVADFRTATNTLAGKKHSMDRGMEQWTNRKAYSVMTNLSNRLSANMVAGSISSALTNFIPITQSWGEVSPVYSLRGMADTVRSAFRDDGTIDKSDFLTNRLRPAENLYKTKWDKISNKVGLLMEIVDGFTSQTVWRSKYRQNLSEDMSENEAIKNADQFAESVMAGRSRGNQPTIFDAKNPVAKMLTSFQLEVANQYGYMLKDMPQDMRNESIVKLVKGYATMFVGAYAYNALYSSLAGRDAAFDPIRIIEELLRDLFDDDEKEEPIDALANLTANALEEVPFVGGLLGGGRIPISSALPYDGNITDMIEGAGKLAEGDFSEITTEWLNPVFYLVSPMMGGQVRKTWQGLSMFSDDLPISGSYTTSGNLRFPVEDTPLNRWQAAIFGQWSSQNAQDYIDEGRSPLQEKQIQEFIDVGMTIQDYWDYRDGLKGLETLSEKADYIDSLDLTVEQKNILINNIAKREEPIDMSRYSEYQDLEELDYAVKNPEKYAVSKVVASDFVTYKQYSKELSEIKSDKDKDGKTISGSRRKKIEKYIDSLDIDYGAKRILLKMEYPSEDAYNEIIVNYLNGRNDISQTERETILKELGFTISSDGTVTWD